MIEQIKSQWIAARDVIESYGYIFNAQNFCKSPLRPTEKTASLYCRKNSRYWRDFGTGKHGDCFTFIMEYENCDFKTACRILENKKFITHKTDEWIVQEVKIEPEFVKKTIEWLARPYSYKSAIKYLENRGISEKTSHSWGVRNGYIWLGNDMKREPCITIPYSLSPDNYWYWKRSTSSKMFRKPPSYKAGLEPVFGYDRVERALTNGKPLLVAESPIDAMSAQEIYGDKYEYCSICGSASEKLRKQLNGRQLSQIIAAVDNDEAGERCAKELSLLCKDVILLKYDGCKDINEYLVNNGRTNEN